MKNIVNNSGLRLSAIILAGLFVSSLLLPPDAWAYRKSAGGGKEEKFDAGTFAVGTAIGIGSSVAGGALASGAGNLFGNTSGFSAISSLGGWAGSYGNTVASGQVGRAIYAAGGYAGLGGQALTGLSTLGSSLSSGLISGAPGAIPESLVKSGIIYAASNSKGGYSPWVGVAAGIAGDFAGGTVSHAALGDVVQGIPSHMVGLVASDMTKGKSTMDRYVINQAFSGAYTAAGGIGGSIAHKMDLNTSSSIGAGGVKGAKGANGSSYDDYNWLGIRIKPKTIENNAVPPGTGLYEGAYGPAATDMTGISEKVPETVKAVPRVSSVIPTVQPAQVWQDREWQINNMVEKNGLSRPQAEELYASWYPMQQVNQPAPVVSQVYSPLPESGDSYYHWMPDEKALPAQPTAVTKPAPTIELDWAPRLKSPASDSQPLTPVDFGNFDINNTTGNALPPPREIMGEPALYDRDEPLHAAGVPTSIAGPADALNNLDQQQPERIPASLPTQPTAVTRPISEIQLDWAPKLRAPQSSVPSVPMSASPSIDFGNFDINNTTGNVVPPPREIMGEPVSYTRDEEIYQAGIGAPEGVRIPVSFAGPADALNNLNQQPPENIPVSSFSRQPEAIKPAREQPAVNTMDTQGVEEPEMRKVTPPPVGSIGQLEINPIKPTVPQVTMGLPQVETNSYYFEPTTLSVAAASAPEVSPALPGETVKPPSDIPIQRPVYKSSFSPPAKVNAGLPVLPPVPQESLFQPAPLSIPETITTDTWVSPALPGEPVEPNIASAVIKPASPGNDTVTINLPQVEPFHSQLESIPQGKYEVSYSGESGTATAGIVTLTRGENPAYPTQINQRGSSGEDLGPLTLPLYTSGSVKLREVKPDNSFGKTYEINVGNK